MDLAELVLRFFFFCNFIKRELGIVLGVREIKINKMVFMFLKVYRLVGEMCIYR